MGVIFIKEIYRLPVFSIIPIIGVISAIEKINCRNDSIIPIMSMT